MTEAQAYLRLILRSRAWRVLSKDEVGHPGRMVRDTPAAPALLTMRGQGYAASFFFAGAKRP
jgi:hypothetical protein